MALLVDESLASREDLADLFPNLAPVFVSRSDLRPDTPFDGRIAVALAELAGVCPPQSVVGLIVPAVWLDDDPAPELVLVTDHVNLELRGPLTGSWPDGMPRTFPSLSGIYQPSDVRLPEGAHVYLSAIVAGVSDMRQLTSFEQPAAREAGCRAASDRLVACAILAAHHGLCIAACAVPTGDVDEMKKESP